MRLSSYLVPFVLAGVPACTVTSGDDADCTGGKCDGAGQSCTDKRYGDGVCDTSIDCAAPDIDCFHTFDDDVAAAAWFKPIEELVAKEQFRAPRNLVATTDPRFVKARELVDRGWAAFRTQRPVAALGERRPALVVVDDATVNAFVSPDLDQQHVGFTIMVDTGLIDSAGSDDAKLGVMMHELQHAVGLHVLASVKQSIQRFYVASYDEPIGRFQTDVPAVRSAVLAWKAAAAEIGAQSSAGLSNLPLDGKLATVLVAMLTDQANNPACANTRALLKSAFTDVTAATDPLTGAATVSPAVTAEIDQAMTALRDECLVHFGKSFVEVAAAQDGVTPAEFEAKMTPEDRALIAGKPAAAALIALVGERRTRMRSIEAAFERDVGSWSSVRYFTGEEDADDTSVMVLRGTQFAPAAIGDFFLTLLPDAVRPQCAAMVADRDVPPYGVDLADLHHATCWRAYHVNAFADHEAAASSARMSARPAIPARDAVPVRQLPWRPRFSDQLAY